MRMGLLRLAPPGAEGLQPFQAWQIAFVCSRMDQVAGVELTSLEYTS